jgi:endoglucanase
MKNFSKRTVLLGIAGCAFFLASCSDGGGGAVVAPSSSSGNGQVDCAEGQAKYDYSFARKVNGFLGRGINLGNGFDGHCSNAANNGENGVEPSGGWDNCWSNAIKQEYFPLLKAAGFQSIRLPVRWNSRAGNSPPYTINPAFTARVKEVVNQAISAGFPVIINIHHYNELIDATGDNLAKEQEKFYELWRQIAREFKDYSNDSLVFELLNEPRNSIKSGQLNTMVSAVWPIIRETNPGRIIMINPAEWGHFTNMTNLRTPPDEKVILSGHQYFPHEFTHQGMSGYPTTGVSWGTAEDRAAMIEQIEGTAEKLKCRFPDVNGESAPLNIGEFGASTSSPEASRVSYNNALRESMEKYNMSWHYWCLTGCQFDVYNKSSSTWNEALLRSLIPEAR